MASHFIASSSSLLNDARRPLSTQDTHCALFNPVAVLLESLRSEPPTLRVNLSHAVSMGGLSKSISSISDITVTLSV